MSVANHRCSFRPSRGGTLIFQPASGEAGTLGIALTANGVDRWLLTCYHVLARPGVGLVATDVIFQPDMASGPIADLRSVMVDPALDVAAAKLLVPASPEVLGIGKVKARTQPLVGMTVIKSGWKTGLSEGRIKQVIGNDVVIERLADFPPDYQLAATGDSGAVWFETSTFAPVAVHRAESAAGQHVAFATDFEAALGSLNLCQL